MIRCIALMCVSFGFCMCLVYSLTELLHSARVHCIMWISLPMPDQKYVCISLYPSLGNLSTQIAQIIEYDLWFWILPYRDKINRMEIFWHIRSFHGYWLAYFFLSVGNIFFCFVRGYFGDNKSFSILHSSQPENLINFLSLYKDYLTTSRKRLTVLAIKEVQIVCRLFLSILVLLSWW